MHNLDQSRFYPGSQDIPDDYRLQGLKNGARYLIDGEILDSDKSADVFSPICYKENGKILRYMLGSSPLLDTSEAQRALRVAENAYAAGMGEWPQMSVGERIAHIENFNQRLRQLEKDFANMEMWEIGKSITSCHDEFKRTIDYIEDTVATLRQLDDDSNSIKKAQGFIAQVRRCPLGVCMIMGPFNYPLNETFAMLMPALIMGNTAIVKLPKYGGLCQEPILEAFREAFPPGVVNIINGDGPTIIQPIIEPGSVAVLGFIGSTAVAKKIMAQHPFNNRLRSILGLEAKNPAFIFPDCDLELAARECVAGALEFNGQRCTAIKHIWVHSSITDKFLAELNKQLCQTKCGMPWEEGVVVTPLAEENKCRQIDKWVEDALDKGAEIVNQGGGQSEGNLYWPTVIYPAKSNMSIYEVEQFGPILPVSTFSGPEEILEYMNKSPYGQQASIFTSSHINAAPMIDMLVTQVSRVNLNAQCRRGPDEFPFTGRKDSAEGTLSVPDALRAFSIRALTVANDQGRELFLQTIEGRRSNFLRI